ncbi:MAG TPA: outer membrane lipoprotein-sorting protein [Polyangiaceae bacterium]|nr:outer membrane lipoprotein-sorting protein [Polyangiaceae bacterium]
MSRLAFVLCSLLLLTSGFSLGNAQAQTTNAGAPSAEEVVRKILESDPLGLYGSQIKASAILTDKRGATSELSFTAISKRVEASISESVVRFSAPPDLAGAGFLQIQNRTGDDDRFLFLPALGRTRRISGNLRGSSFMGTDFSFADLDRRDLREGQAKSLSIEKIGAYSCYVVDVVPRRDDSPYSHLEMWVRGDNFLVLRTKMYNLANVHVKTFEAQEIRRVKGNWFVSRSLMTDHRIGHTTLLVLQEIIVNPQIGQDEFSVRALERP